ncbi:butyryl-CoA dehydrogenase [Klebsiella pneumoniae]|uniref:Butyryl-CoA dehydrogenase n=1 Tax=Klebsiella pneumoniae TaxID=573 RepID=A0A2X3EG43_KLEPN|nr:butyryl-CoA dehydrogenase [Klebsiella pneumoniae]
MQYLHHLRLAENDAWHAPLRQQVFHDAVEHGGLINSLRVEPELGSPARGGLPDTGGDPSRGGLGHQRP